MTKRLKILFVGLGAIGQRHARNLRKLHGKNIDLLAYRASGQNHVLTDRLEIRKRGNLERDLNIKTFCKYEKALMQKPNAVIISNPSSLHLRFALRAAQKGCHLFIEKPLSADLKGVDSLIKVIKKKKLISLVGLQLRFHPLLLYVKKLIESKKIDNLISVICEFGEYLPDWHPYEDYRKSYAARQELGGGVLLTQIHDFDYLGWLFGWPSKVFCLGGKLSKLELNVEDTANTLLECGTDIRKIPVFVHQDYLQRPKIRKFKIITDGGLVAVDLISNTLSIHHKKRGKTKNIHFPTKSRNQPYLSEMRHFLACLNGKENSRVSVEESVKSLRVAVAASKSLQNGKAVLI
jgi:predicted dehydrogenase